MESNQQVQIKPIMQFIDLYPHKSFLVEMEESFLVYIVRVEMHMTARKKY